jgi:hypothetical protein
LALIDESTAKYSTILPCVNHPASWRKRQKTVMVVAGEVPTRQPETAWRQKDAAPCGKSPELSGWRGVATVLAITASYFFRTRQRTDKLDSIGERTLSTPERKGFRMCGKVSDFPH